MTKNESPLSCPPLALTLFWGPNGHLPNPELPRPVTDQIQTLLLPTYHLTHSPPPGPRTSTSTPPDSSGNPSPHSLFPHSLSVLSEIHMPLCHSFSIILHCPQDKSALSLCGLLSPVPANFSDKTQYIHLRTEAHPASISQRYPSHCLLGSFIFQIFAWASPPPESLP